MNEHDDPLIPDYDGACLSNVAPALLDGRADGVHIGHGGGHHGAPGVGHLAWVREGLDPG